MASNDDKTIISKVLEGDTMAFGELVIKYQDTVFRMVYRITGSYEDSRDICQDVFLRIFEKLDKYNPRYKFFSWLYRSAINESLDFMKRNKNAGMLHNTEGLSDVAVEDDDSGTERQRELRKALIRLPEKQRTLLIMKYFGGYSYDEISNITGLPVKRIKSRLYDGRDKLRKMLS